MINAIKEEEVEARKQDFSQSQQKLMPKRKEKNFIDDEFRNLRIVPSSIELKTNLMQKLDKIPTKGGFRDEEDYLSTHFKLLREDFARDLRDGFYEFNFTFKPQNRMSTIIIYPEALIDKFYLNRDLALLELKILLTTE
jgi:hypothetical protein